MPGWSLDSIYSDLHTSDSHIRIQGRAITLGTLNLFHAILKTQIIKSEMLALEGASELAFPASWFLSEENCQEMASD